MIQAFAKLAAVALTIVALATYGLHRGGLNHGPTVESYYPGVDAWSVRNSDVLLRCYLPKLERFVIEI